MTILVLGGAGYIGSHAVDQLVQKGYQVAVVEFTHRSQTSSTSRCSFL